MSDSDCKSSGVGDIEVVLIVLFILWTLGLLDPKHEDAKKPATPVVAEKADK